MSRDDFELSPVRKRGCDAALIFIHGYGGHATRTWGEFPNLIAMDCHDRDIFALGYPTTFTPDLFGIWSSDPAIDLVSKLVALGFKQGELARYDKIAVVAHSMGGLVTQRMLIDDKEVGDRVTHLIMFGTPNNGVRLATMFRKLFRKKSAKNMVENSLFIKRLREDWKTGRSPGLKTAVVAGASDRFVDYTTAHAGFSTDEQYVVDGDHLTMVKPSQSGSLAVGLVLKLLAEAESDPVPAPTFSELKSNHEQEVQGLLKKQASDRRGIRDLGQEHVDLALRLEKEGDPRQAVKVLSNYLDEQEKFDPLSARSQNTDALGSLGGQLKRIWFKEMKEPGSVDDRDSIADEIKTYPETAMRCYTDALYHSFLNDDNDQIYYQAINVAFGALVWYHDHDLMERAASTAEKHAQATRDSFWKWATIAEAYLYLGNNNGAIRAYETAVTLDLPSNHGSTSFQALTIVEAMAEQNLLSGLQAKRLASRLNEIFYSETLNGMDDPGEIESLINKYDPVAAAS